MPSIDERLQHFQKEIDGLRKRIQQFERNSDEKQVVEQQPQKRRFDATNVALMTLFTGLLVISSGLQWKATRDAITDTHTSFETGTRAWVVLKDVQIKPTKPDTPVVPLGNGIVRQHAIVQEGNGLKDSHAPAISAEFVNAGHSPAINLAQNSRIEIIDKLPTNDFLVPPAPAEQLASTFVVAPDGTFDANQGMLLSDEQLANIKSGKKFLAIYGDVTYEDIFNRQHETKYCQFYEPNIEMMTFCAQYNSAN
jgi:hypothetical protein